MYNGGTKLCILTILCFSADQKIRQNLRSNNSNNLITVIRLDTFKNINEQANVIQYVNKFRCDLNSCVRLFISPQSFVSNRLY